MRVRRISRAVVTVLIAATLSCTASLAQTAPSAAKSEFEVASVRPSGPLDVARIQAMVAAGQMPRFGVHIDGLTVQYLRVPLKQLIARAYDVLESQVTAPKDLGNDPFDITAHMPEGSTKDNERAMLLTLLQQRFKLQATKASDDTPVFNLVVGKSGPKLKESTTRLEPIDPSAELKPNEMKQETPMGTILVRRNPDGTAVADMGEKGKLTQKIDMQSRSLVISGPATIAGFAQLLTQIETAGPMASRGGRPVIDATGLKGVYDIALEISLNSFMGPQQGASGTEASDPGGAIGLDESLQKMGLKLDPAKAPIPHVTVTHIDKTPTEN